MIEDSWHHICGVHFQPGVSGAGAVWIALDKKADVVHMFDCALYPNEPPIMIATALNKHGRWIPIAWEQTAKPLVDQLLERGCNTLPDPVKQTEVQAEAVNREIVERMRTGRFKVDKWLVDWVDEYKGYMRDEGLVPLKTHPLMSATRYAMANIEFARRRERRKGKDANINYPKVAII